MESVQVPSEHHVASPKVRILRGVFYWEVEHSLDDFEIQEYSTYKDAMLDSLDKARTYFSRNLNDEDECMGEERRESASEAIKQIEADVARIQAGETPQNLAYSDHCSEFHMKIM